MQKLTGFDAAFLHFETTTSHMHVGQACVFDPSTAPGDYGFDSVRQLVEERLHLLPPFRRRLAEVPLSLHHPVWIEDPNFELDYHLRRAALPAPGGPAELASFSAEVMGRPLDRDRPPWEMYVVEGLEGGKVAGISKVHHSAIDGVSGAELTANLLDLSSDPGPAPPPESPWEPDRVPSALELMRSAVAAAARQPITAVTAARRTIGAALALRSHNRQPGVVPPPPPFSAPRTSLQTAVGPHRRVAFAQASLEEVKAVKNAVGATVNDVVLAMCAGALRSLLAERNEHPDSSLVAAVPVSVRTEHEQGTMGNRVSAMLVSLASAVEDPVERLRTIAAGARQAKEQEQVFSVSNLADWAELLAPGVLRRAARLASGAKVMERLSPIFNVIVSNFAGPPLPLYCAGARLLAAYPMGPVSDGAPLNITVQSYMDRLCFGLVACRQAVPEVADVARRLTDSLDELSKATGASRSPVVEYSVVERADEYGAEADHEGSRPR